MNGAARVPAVVGLATIREIAELYKDEATSTKDSGRSGGKAGIVLPAFSDAADR
ncbi:MAG TPA: hypothetical protein VK593_07925 [Edaphobacter sp.]|nr:hypothetical protein [Edaphobacter sp.]